MKNKEQKTLEIQPEVIFELTNNPPEDQGDPTTTLGGTTFTGIQTIFGGWRDH